MPSEPAPPPAAPPPAGARPAAAPAGRRPRDMVLSLVALIVPLAVLGGIYKYVQRGDEPRVADVAPVLDEARRAGDFPVAAPGDLPGWRPASATYAAGDGRAVLRIGYEAPSGAGLQLVESDRPADALLADELGPTRPAGAVAVAGRDWQRYPGRPGEEALVLLAPERTVLVLGPAGAPELATLAGKVVL
ncbi:hypothetical protein GCM10010123_32820 [Pilimelia anulata]|uniref:DUF4245 domain-containing protein n=1 Tax=Pilimelia anulata TaxID=53371 RepID=A0A8J3FEG5_9ACTN|nr:DUF4245 domain-containing protein [Pilimelia anulata]GGK00346.1 hypothetical protein GCM10010123_32820 [Pilimelia anulata]